MPSTVIAHKHYFPETGTLRIVFVSGLVYDYKNVPAEVYEQFHAAFSKGTFFNSHIKPNYAFVKVDPASQSSNELKQKK